MRIAWLVLMSALLGGFTALPSPARVEDRRECVKKCKADFRAAHRKCRSTVSAATRAECVGLARNTMSACKLACRRTA
jgi:hypothetical protein